MEYSSARLWSTLSDLKTKMDGSESVVGVGLGMPVTQEEIARVVLTVAFAITNSCSLLALILLRMVADCWTDKTTWDVERYADRVKNSRVRGDGALSAEDRKLSSYFGKLKFGEVDEPTTLIDQYSRILLWHLPDILCKARVVSDFVPTHCIFLRFSCP